MEDVYISQHVTSGKVACKTNIYRKNLRTQCFIIFLKYCAFSFEWQISEKFTQLMITVMYWNNKMALMIQMWAQLWYNDWYYLNIILYYIKIQHGSSFIGEVGVGVGVGDHSQEPVGRGKGRVGWWSLSGSFEMWISQVDINGCWNSHAHITWYGILHNPAKLPSPYHWQIHHKDILK